MLKILKSSVRDTFIYSVGTFSSKLTGLILVPIYTNDRYLSANDYGILNLIEANLQLLIIIFTFGLSFAFERWYWDKEYIEKRRPIFFTILVFTSMVASVLLVASLLFSAPLSALLFDNQEYAYIVVLMFLNAGLEIIAQTPNSLMRLSEKPMLYTTANLSKLITSVTLTVIFLIPMQMGLKGVYYAQIIGLAAYFLMLSRFIIANSILQFEWRITFDMIRFRLPLLMPILALGVLNFSDRYIISNLSGMADTGVYSLGAKLANTIKVFLITAIWLALTPTIYKMMDQPNNKRFYSKVMTYLSFTVIIFMMIFSFFSEELIILVSDESIYMGASHIIPLTALAIFFGMLKDVSLIGLNITKRLTAVGTTTIAIMLINIGANFLFVPIMGILGAAVANVLCQILFFIIIFQVAQKNYTIPYEIGKIFKMLAVAFILFGVAWLLNPLNLWLKIPLKLLLIVLFPFLLYLFNFYEPIELERLKGFWQKWKDPGKWKENLTNLQF
jgi:O-antigen/teichoic acid export membrane protein